MSDTTDREFRRSIWTLAGCVWCFAVATWTGDMPWFSGWFAGLTLACALDVCRIVQVRAAASMAREK